MYKTESSRWQAIQRRDQTASSSFIYAVVSTKIYCRPGCPSRLARRANVCFYDTAADAIRDGYRACLRCKPDLPSFNMNGEQAQRDIVGRACDFIVETKGDAKFADVAKNVGLSTRYLYGLFKAIMGTTPAKFAATLKPDYKSHGHSVAPPAASGATSPIVGRPTGPGLDTNSWSAQFDLDYADIATAHESTDWLLQYNYIDGDALVAIDFHNKHEAVDTTLSDSNSLDPILNFTTYE